jgi:hypothetical protein
MNAHSTISRCYEEQFQLSKFPFSQCHCMRGSWVDWSSHFGHLHRALIGVNAFERGPQYRVPSRDFLYLSPYVFCTVTCHPLYFRALSKARPGNHDPFLDKPPFLVQAFTMECPEDASFWLQDLIRYMTIFGARMFCQSKWEVLADCRILSMLVNHNDVHACHSGDYGIMSSLSLDISTAKLDRRL